MCFDLDSHPPIAPIAGGALDQASLVLTGADGNRLLAFRARASEPSGAGIVILPDVRGLHPYYEELALRFAEAGIDALAIDYFGRTAGLDTSRDDRFEYRAHVDQTTWAGLANDVRAGVAEVRSDATRVTTLFIVGFCFGGRLAYDAATLGLDATGTIGFYGRTLGEHPSGMPVPVDVAASMRGDILGLFGGADQAIPPEAVAAFDTALRDAGVAHRLVTYDGAPHSFFDRKAADFADASTAAWAEVLGFIRSRTG
jgi:carboxymethylenebutenolidase